MGFLRLFSRSGPKIKVLTTKKDGFSGWLKCSGCGETIHADELVERCNCCPKCNFHYRQTLHQRIKLLTDEGTFQEKFTSLKSIDPLDFVDQESYKDRLSEAQKKTGRDDAACVGLAKIEEIEVAIGFLDFSFMGGSMGSLVGERLTLLMEMALKQNLPLVIVSASGGARMQESILSLMQMAKTSAALAKLHEKGLPYISVLTNPTTGGVTASFASLGDIILAEPGALIGFAGPRVVEQTTRQKLPEGAQKSEFLKSKGMVDQVVSREKLKSRIAFFLSFLEKIEVEIEQKIEEMPIWKKFLQATVGSKT